ncbi:MAG: hypothetical protein HY706_20745 [Candidatus Hydrogenedentes bacterium]|nr:hypothetical protein [Candidatus Hydrogenedentota bacterium]
MQRPTSVTVGAVLAMYLGLMLLIFSLTQCFLTFAAISANVSARTGVLDYVFFVAGMAFFIGFSLLEIATGIWFITTGVGLFLLKSRTWRSCVAIRSFWITLFGGFAIVMTIAILAPAISSMDFVPFTVNIGGTKIFVSGLVLLAIALATGPAALYILVLQIVLWHPKFKAAFRAAAEDRGEVWTEPTNIDLPWWKITS